MELREFDETYLTAAVAEGEKSWETGAIPIGAVLAEGRALWAWTSVSPHSWLAKVKGLE